MFSVSTNGAKILTNGANSESGDISEQRKGREEYFDKPVYLTVSGQLHLEAVCNGIAKVNLFSLFFENISKLTFLRPYLESYWKINLIIFQLNCLGVHV